MNIVNVRCPIAKTKKQALALFTYTDQCRVSDVTSPWDGKPCNIHDLADVNGRRPFLERATVQIRYAADRKVTIVTVAECRKASREDLPVRKAAVSPDARPKTSPAAALDVYRQCVVALGVLDLPVVERPHRWRDRLPLYMLATARHRAAIDLGEVDEITVAIKARDAAYRLATIDGRVPV